MPQDVYSLASDLVDETAEVMPVAATYMGVPGHDHRWDDLTTAGAEREWEMAADQLRRVRALEPSGDPAAALAGRIIEASLEEDLELYEHDEHFLDLNSNASSFQRLRDVFDVMPTATHEHWEAVADRLEGLPVALHALGSRLDDGRRRGLAVAARQVREVVRQARNHAAGDSFFASLPGSFAEAGIDDTGLDERIAGAVPRVREAFSEFARWLEETYLPHAPQDDAVGEERYVRLARRFLGESLDPKVTYEWGWSEVERLRGRMAEVAGRVSPGATTAEALHLLQTDPDRAAGSPEEFRRLMIERQESALRELDGAHFDVPEPIREIEVRLTPPGGPLAIYYVDPSEDFSRPGTVWWSLGDRRVIPLFDQISTAYHEGFPGHHLQLGFQVAGPGRLSRYHRMCIWYPGTGEGWALYAEDLMEELGYLEKPDYVMGKLASEMLRAARVVIDIGSHLRLPIPDDQPFHPGEPWTFETGIEMLVDVAAQDPAMAEAEMRRYLGWPGQAISYKIGQQAIRDLREEAQQRLGDGFDPKVFHARMLEAGSVGLDTLREHMREGW